MEKKEFLTIGRGYLLVFTVVLCSTGLTVLIILKDPKSTASMLTWMKEIVSPMVMAVIGAKEIGKAVTGLISKKPKE